MKTRKFLFMIISIFAITLAMPLLSSCNDDDDKETETTEESSYKGSITVTYSGQDFKTDGIVVSVDPDDNGTTLDIELLKVKFVPQMPVSLDIEIPDVSYTTASDGTISFSAENIVPTCGGVEYPNYTETGLSGSIKNGTLAFSLKFGEFPTSYTGAKI